MNKYEVVWCTGDYPERQQFANDAGCDGYVEHHFNALAYDRPGIKDNPVLCIVGHNASQTSKNWAADYSQLIVGRYGFRNSGVIQVEKYKRGDQNMRYFNKPCILVEPLFVSEPEQAAIALSPEGQQTLGLILADSIMTAFPNGAKMGFSIGHRGKSSSPYDTGAPVVGSKLTEADLSEAVLKVAASDLVGEKLPEIADPTPLPRDTCACPNCGKGLILSAS